MNRTVINFKCKKCKKTFDCDVGAVSVDMKTDRPKFTNKIVCPRCGERSIDGVLLTERGQSQLTEATF
jgi:DNA-directed RNA polymerase subunit RPC12/RpoP